MARVAFLQLSPYLLCCDVKLKYIVIVRQRKPIILLVRDYNGQ